MLGADLVCARRRGDALVLAQLDAKGTSRARELAAMVLEVIRESVGGSRDRAVQALREIPASARERKLTDGLVKLALDACEFAALGADAAALRREVFARASAARREGRFDRDAVLEEVARERAMAARDVDAALFADRKGEERLERAPALSPESLVAAWREGQAQAVLLRAVKLDVRVACASPAAYRALFRKLKFLRLLHVIEASDEGGYRIAIDGPMSLFDHATSYGLKLALLLPSLEACDRFELRAELRWGADRRPLAFELAGGASTEAAEPELPDDVAAFLRAFARVRSPWRAAPATEILAVPGAGVCVPDVTFERDDGARVHLEVLGYWSRDAVFRRLDLARRGLGAPIVFAASERLRVSEELLDGSEAAALHVYKGALGARAVLDRVEQLAASAKRPASTG